MKAVLSLRALALKAGRDARAPSFKGRIHLHAAIIETITHPAFYSGWPNAMTAVTVAKEVFEKKMTREGQTV